MENKRFMQVNLTPDVVDSLRDADILDMLEDFMNMRQVYGAAIKEVRTKLEILDEEFSVQYDHNPIHHIEYRLKRPASIADKLIKKGKEVSTASMRENLTDVAGVRVICNYIEDIYRIADLLVNQNDITLVRTRDYIAHPKENGYRSLHLIVKIPVFLSRGVELVPVEIQIRTIAMDFWASLEHQLRYKTRTRVPERLRTQLSECADAIADLDQRMQDIYRQITGKADTEEAPRPDEKSS